jgi:hypothetical protein
VKPPTGSILFGKRKADSYSPKCYTMAVLSVFYNPNLPSFEKMSKQGRNDFTRAQAKYFTERNSGIEIKSANFMKIAGQQALVITFTEESITSSEITIIVL